MEGVGSKFQPAPNGVRVCVKGAGARLSCLDPIVHHAVHNIPNMAYELLLMVMH
jgi:hypothetical protein